MQRLLDVHLHLPSFLKEALLLPQRKEGKHRKSFIGRFPNLNEIPFEFSWGGRVCLSLNGAPAFGELDENLFSACCSNGLGTVKGTLAGKLGFHSK